MKQEEFANFENERRLLDGLRRLGEESRRREAPASVERRLLATFRAETSSRRPPITRWWVFGSWAAALAVTAAMAIFLVKTHQPEQTKRAQDRSPQMAIVEHPQDPELADAEFPADFIPIPNTEGISPNEPVNLVRLELSRSDMAALGVSVNDDVSEEPVEADVMLGADGIARAVRFLD